MEELNSSLELDKLREIGTKEIFEKTRIPINRIEQILARNFKKIGNNRVAVRGSLQILEREYKVKLNAWLKEYDAFFGFGAKEQDENKSEQNAQKITKQKENTSPTFPNLHKSKIEIFEVKAQDEPQENQKEEPQKEPQEEQKQEIKKEIDSMPFFSKKEPQEESQEESQNELQNESQEEMKKEEQKEKIKKEPLNTQNEAKQEPKEEQEVKEEPKEETNSDSPAPKTSKRRSKKQKAEQELNEQNKNSENLQIDSIKNNLEQTNSTFSSVDIESKNTEENTQKESKSYWDFGKKDSIESDKKDSIDNSLKSSSFEVNKTDSIESKIESNNTNLATNENDLQNNLQNDSQNNLEENESPVFAIFIAILILIFVGIAAYINSDWLLSEFPFLKDIFGAIDSVFKDILSLIGV